MIGRWWLSILADSPESMRRELRGIIEELAWLEREHERLSERRDELVTELKPELRLVQP